MEQQRRATYVLVAHCYMRCYAAGAAPMMFRIALPVLYVYQQNTTSKNIHSIPLTDSQIFKNQSNPANIIHQMQCLTEWNPMKNSCIKIRSKNVLL